MNILCVGPLSPPITGQSLCFEFYVKNSKHNMEVINTNLANLSFFIKILLTFKFFFIFSLRVFFNRYDALYITTSRSFFGFFPDSFFILVFKLINGGLIVNHLHGADFISFRNQSGIVWLIDFIYSKIDISIVLSDEMKEQYKFYKNMKIEVVPNFSEYFLSPKHLGRKKESFISDGLNVLYLSNLIYSKGITFLLDAIKMVNDKGYKVNLLIAGQFFSDEYMSASELNQYVISQISDSIQYLGVVHEDKFSYLENADILCLPTFYKTEAQPLAIIEGLANANLVITTNHNYNRDFLPVDAVVWINKQSTVDIYNKLIDIYNNRDAYVNTLEVGYEYACSSFDKELYISKIDSIFVNNLNCNNLSVS